jgi:hypothetical protein
VVHQELAEASVVEWASLGAHRISNLALSRSIRKASAPRPLARKAV